MALAGVLLGALPTTLQSLVRQRPEPTADQRLQYDLHQCTRPFDPLYLLGHKMLSTYPYVPIGGEMGMNCAVMSYDGTCLWALPETRKRFRTGGTGWTLSAESFAQLRDATGVHIPKRKGGRV